MANLAKSPLLRRFVIVAPLVIVVLLAILLLVPSPGETPPTPTIPPATVAAADATPAVPPAASPTPAATPVDAARMPFGVQLPDRLDDAQVVQRLMELGASWARANFYWRDIEPQRTDPPTYDWQSLDALLTAVAPARLNLILTLHGNPDWAAATPCGPLNAAGLAGLADLLDAMVRRYARSVRFWEMYNEPDHDSASVVPHSGGCWGRDGEGYAAMLSVAYAAIKRADPQAVVLHGGVAYEDFDTDVFVPDFLDTVLETGGGAHFDVLNFHYYPAFADVWNRYGSDVIGKADYLRAELERYGLSKPLILTEIGQPTDGPAADAQPYSDERTAAYVVQALVRSVAADLEAVIWFSLLDRPQDPRKYGLLNDDGSPKQAYVAYQTLAREVGETAFGRALPTEELGGAGIEGYEFLAARRTHWVVWAMDGQTHDVALPVGAVRRVNLYGDAGDVADGGEGDADGQADGRVTVAVGPEPVYLDWEPSP